MIFAVGFSLLFTFTVGAWAAKSKKAEYIIIPLIDIAQSLPPLGFLSLTVYGWIMLFPKSLMGFECAAIFTIFTAQVWNMVLSFYQSLRTVPASFLEASHVFHLTTWQRFVKVEVPFAVPALLWNTILSLSAGWFFVVSSEVITANAQIIYLPGIGSYIAKANMDKNYHAIGWAILAMIIVIFLINLLFFRPLQRWSRRYLVHGEEQVVQKSLIYQVF